MDSKTIALDAQKGLNIVNTVLPILETFVPQVAAGSAISKLAISGAQALIPLIEQIPIGGETISVDEQAALKSRVDDIVSGKAFDGPEWAPSGLGQSAPVTGTDTSGGAQVADSSN